MRLFVILLHYCQSFTVTSPEYRQYILYSMCTPVLVHLHPPVSRLGIALTLYLCAGIESEWRKTQCIPREVCVDVGREFGAPTNIFYKPPCVSVYRCGGCCHSEDKQCRNISTGYLSKTVSTSHFLFYCIFHIYCQPAG